MITFSKRELFLLRKQLHFYSFHYLRANTAYGANGYEKAQNHKEIIKIIISFLTLDERSTGDFNLVSKVRELMAENLTDNLDVHILLPLEKILRGNEWDQYINLFINKIIEMLPDIMTLIENRKDE